MLNQRENMKCYKGQQKKIKSCMNSHNVTVNYYC